MGILDVTFYRDDFRTNLGSPKVGASNILFEIDGKTVILIDDVLYTGRTIRAAMDEIFTYDTEEELYKKLLDIKPDVRILGSDYIGKSFTGDDLDIKVYHHDRNHNYSTTNLRKKIVSEHIH